MEPVCENPVVLIRNNGSEPVSSFTFHYGVEGDELQTYTFTSDEPLEFLEELEVNLHTMDLHILLVEKMICLHSWFP